MKGLDMKKKNGIKGDKINKIMWKESDWEIVIIIIVIKGKQD